MDRVTQASSTLVQYFGAVAADDCSQSQPASDQNSGFEYPPASTKPSNSPLVTGCTSIQNGAIWPVCLPRSLSYADARSSVPISTNPPGKRVIPADPGTGPSAGTSYR